METEVAISGNSNATSIGDTEIDLYADVAENELTNVRISFHWYLSKWDGMYGIFRKLATIMVVVVVIHIFIMMVISTMM